MANTLIKNAPTGRGSGGGNGSGGSGGGSTGSGTGGSSCQQAQNAAVAELFPGYARTGAGNGAGSNGGVQVTGPNGDVWRIASPGEGSCSNGYVKVEYEMVGYRLRSG